MKAKKDKTVDKKKKAQPPPPPELQGFQRKHLRGLAHGLRAVVQVGHGGVSDGVIAAVEQALADHELIKVRMYQPEDKKQMATELAERSHAALCGLVGHHVVLYKPHPKKPTIVLPKRPSAREDRR